jgi:hypothetical protein
MLKGKRYQLRVITSDGELVFSASEVAINNQMTRGGRKRKLTRILFHRFSLSFRLRKYASTTNKKDYSSFFYPDLLESAIVDGYAKNDVVEYRFLYPSN